MNNIEKHPKLLEHRRALAYSLGHKIGDSELLQMNRAEFGSLVSEDKRDLHKNQNLMSKNDEIEMLRNALKSVLVEGI